MLQQQRFCGDGAHATWAEKFREGGYRVESEHEEFASATNDIIPAALRGTVD